MSDTSETRVRNRLDRFLDELKRLTNEYDLEQDVDILVDVLETSTLAESSERLREARDVAEREEARFDTLEATASGRRCNPLKPRCPRGSKCMLRGGSLEYRCFP